MKRNSNARPAKKWALSKLKPHPSQPLVFDDLAEAELDALVESMRVSGLRQPIDILPDGTIVGGHQRVLAAKRLGWKTIDVIVRHDLAKQGEAAILAFLIDDNLRRRQLGRLEVARCYRQLQEIYRASPQYRQDWEGDLRERLAPLFGKSGRQLDRDLRLLDLPRPIQLAFSQRRLPASIAERLLILDENEMQQAVTAIEDGEDPRVVAKRMLRKPTGKHRLAIGALTCFLKLLGKSVLDLEDRVENMRVIDAEHRSVLEKARSLISTILRNSLRKAK